MAPDGTEGSLQIYNESWFEIDGDGRLLAAGEMGDDNGRGGSGWRVASSCIRTLWQGQSNPTKKNSKHLYMMLMYENHVFDLRIEANFEVWNPLSFFNAAYVVTR